MSVQIQKYINKAKSMKRVIGAYQNYFINSCTDLKIIQNKKLAKNENYNFNDLILYK